MEPNHTCLLLTPLLLPIIIWLAEMLTLLRKNPLNFFRVQLNVNILYLRRSMFGCNHAAKYAAAIWNPHNLGDIQLLESLQERAARWIAGVHLPALGPFPQMIVAPNFTFLLSSQDKVSFQPQLSSGTLFHFISLKTVIESLSGIFFIITYRVYVSINFCVTVLCFVVYCLVFSIL